MSYILDALKKSERERQRGSVPDVLTPEDSVVGQTRKRRLLPYLILCALVLSAGLLVGWLMGHSKKPQIVSQSAAARQVREKAPVPTKDISAAGASVAAPSPERIKTGNPVVRPSKERTEPVSTAKKSLPDLSHTVQQGQPPSAVAEQKRTVEKRPAATVAPKETRENPASAAPQQTVLSHAPAEPQPVKHAETPIKNKIYSVKELPADMQQNLPDFSISTHLYAGDTASRVVRINVQMLREGQYLSAGLKLEEITPDGVVFSLDNYRFRVGLR